MDVAQHAVVLWRFRAILVGGLLLGALLALLAAYQLPSLTPRGSERWSSQSSLLVTQTGFPEGRTTLPTAPPVDSDGSSGVGGGSREAGGQLEFADPDRLSALASLYAHIAVSDRVRKLLPGDPETSRIEALPVEGNAATQLPLIQLTTFADSGPGARALNLSTGEALERVLKAEQSENAIPARQRIQLSLLNAPAAPVKVAGRSHTASILAFLLCFLGSVALAHLLAAVRDGREEEPLDGVVVPWSAADRAPEPDLDGGVPDAPSVAEPAPSRWQSGVRWRR